MAATELLPPATADFLSGAASSATRISFFSGFRLRRSGLLQWRRTSLLRRLLPLRIPHSKPLNCIPEPEFQPPLGEDAPDFSPEKSDSVDVIGIGSRKEAVFDFCLESSFASCFLNFWTIHMSASQSIQLLQRSIGEDVVIRNVEVPYSIHLSSRAVILIATAGYGSDHVPASELLRAVKGIAELVVVIVVKPFSFEGRRRQQEVENLLSITKECANVCLVVDTDALLKKEAVTLSEALKSANSAVLLAINMIYVLTSDKHLKLFDSPNHKMEELKVSEIVELLEDFDNAEVGFGAGGSIKASIARAVFDCPFLSSGLKGMNGIVVCNLASSVVMNTSDLHSFMSTFRRITQCTCEVVVSFIHELDLKDDMILTTILVMRKHEISQKKGFFSRLASHFPFVFSFLGAKDTDYNEPVSSDSVIIMDLPETRESNSINGASYSPNVDSDELEALLSDDFDGACSWRNLNEEEQRHEVGFSQANGEAVYMEDQINEGGPFQREALLSWKFGPGFCTSPHWVQERAASSETSAKIEKMDTYPLPVGVRSAGKSTDGLHLSSKSRPTEAEFQNDAGGGLSSTAKLQPFDALSDAGFVAVADIYNTVSTVVKGRSSDLPTKQGLLSARAASMLEAERGSHNKWRPVMEMQYRGGIYRGRCEGGLPEGKGRLTLTDGSFYDGMWRYGMRSGLGTFCYPNGDVFKGSWRDDLIHGKGWFYFHTGDRWFANFWKGKASGEGRFYSKSGDIFFGHFQDGWRNGQSLYIDSDGTRWNETWDHGVLISRNKLDFEAD